MGFFILRPFIIASTALLVTTAFAGAQQMPPAEPPLPLPKVHTDAPTLRVTANEVLVPTLVEKPGGGVVYGLKPQDFVLEDNGVPQKIRVQEELDTAPVALVVAVEQGGVGVLEFNKLAKLGPLLDLFLSDGKGQAALVGFDSKPHLIRDFTHSSEEVNTALKHLEPGDGGDAILDTVSYAVDLLETQPKEYRRVLLLISEERDHGSKHIKTAQLIEKIGRSDVLVLSVSFTPARAELSHDIKDSGEDRTMSMISSLFMLVQAFKKNVTKEIAHMSGGEYHVFTGDKGFEKRVVESAQHARNRYLITFSPSDPTPGLHTIRVRLAEDYGARVVARANYWREAEQ
ncbi:MAG: VWA domain-containing protein [Terracidiphilus sp.]|jgi:VWFA-related protein